MRRRALPPFSIKRMLRQPSGLLTRLELAFALEPVHRIQPKGQLRGGRRATVTAPGEAGGEPPRDEPRSREE